jgi:hypothetical protein
MRLATSVGLETRVYERGDDGAFHPFCSWDDHQKVVKVVKLSSDGIMVASGDDAGIIMVRNVNSSTLVFKVRKFENDSLRPRLFSHTQCPNFQYKFRATDRSPLTFIWAIDISDDGKRLAAGSWNSEIRVWSTGSWRPLCPVLERSDRIYSVKLSHDGGLMVSGDRSQTAALWEVGDLKTRATTLLWEIHFPNRIYSVDLSQDNKFVALGGLHKEIWILETSSKRVVQRLDIDSALNEGATLLSFSLDGRALAAGHDTTLSVWKMQSNDYYEPFLVLARKHPITSCCFSEDVLAASVGAKVLIYGEPDILGPSFRERPDFEVLSEFLENTAATKTVLSAFPSIANSRSSHTGEAIKQRCCRMHSQETLQILLNHDPLSAVGFVRDFNGMTALKAALLLEKKNSVMALLGAVADGRVGTSVSSLHSVSECFPLLSIKFPRLFLDFICSMSLLEEPKYTKKYNPAKALLPGAGFFGINFLVRGTESATENAGLWDRELSTRGSESSLSLFGRLFSGDDAVSSEVVSSRVVFENFAGRYSRTAISPLHLIITAAYKEKRMDVFKSPMVSHSRLNSPSALSVKSSGLPLPTILSVCLPSIKNNTGVGHA